MEEEMVSRYHYFQGQNPENTKISDRTHALHITGGAWKKINTHLDRKKLAREVLEKEERHRAYLDDGSKAMIKNWANSLENIRKRKDEERIQAIENEKAERARKFHELRKEQEEIRKAFVEKANRNIFMNKGNAKQLTSAFIMSEVFYERERQKEFKQFLKEHEEEEYAQEVENVREVAREAAEEEKEHIEKEKKKKLEMGEYFRKELEEKNRKEKERADQRRRREEREYADALNEMKCIERKTLDMKLKKKEELMQQMQKLLEVERQKKVISETEEQELDDVVRAYRATKERIDCRTKMREKEIRDEAIEIRRKMAEKAKAEQNEQLAEEKRERIFQKAVKEFDELAIQKDAEKAQRLAQEASDKTENYKEHLKKEEERIKTEAELRKWEMLNRYKTTDAMDKFDKDAKMERRNKILKYRADLLEQMAENEAVRKKEEEIDKILTQAMSKTDDDKFFAYADEILAQERKTGRSTYPTEKAIIGYKKNFNILPRTDIKFEAYKTSKERNAVDICKQYANEMLQKRKCKCRQSTK
ncbi:cilia- and flagella- associated protein 210-like [Diabrotica virgifera virgifera]|uniref:Coiled-coil domain-containing protein 173-like n=1 Tax=Diabrotica virgifera virgifera TaxID=50390 RepID=A0A6P7G8J5_DIAVI|nr:cilia- and flagella- associated protein 210-like [Diabrotica virgifera virgifera]